MIFSYFKYLYLLLYLEIVITLDYIIDRMDTLQRALDVSSATNSITTDNESDMARFHLNANNNGKWIFHCLNNKLKLHLYYLIINV